MPARLRRTVRSFAVVFAAFWVYRLLVAPWIDPSFAMVEQSGAIGASVGRAGQAEALRLRKYAGIFPPGSWELDQPIMIESDGVELLMKDYENLAGGRIKLSQCTMLYLSPGEAEGRDSGRVVILRAPEGAIMQFDSDLNLRRGKVGKLQGGELKGPVTIHGTPSRPGANDELLVATRDVRMDGQRIWSDNTVQFRYGPHQGGGRGLVIKLLPENETGGQRRGPSIGGFERIELLRDVKMTMQPGSTGLFPGDGDTGAAAVPLPDPITGHIANRETPVEIRCQGPFHFELARRMASFRDQVDVRRMLSNGQSDQLTCDELQIFFGDKTQHVQESNPLDGHGEAMVGPNEQRLALQIERLIAIGSPAAVVAPSNDVNIRANRLDYEFKRRRMTVEAAPHQPDASLTWGENKFGGRSLIVERSNPNSVPLVTAKGAGWFDISDPDDSRRTINAHWARELVMRPDEGSHRVSLVGDAQTRFAQMGELKARQIDLWLIQLDRPPAHNVNERASKESITSAQKTKNKPPTRGQPQNQVAPVRLLAVGDIRFDSPRLTGDTEELQVWFDPAGTLRPTPLKSKRLPMEPSGGPLVPDATSPDPNASAVATRDALVLNSSSNNRLVEQPATPPAHFELHGNSIQVRLVSQGEQTNVDFVEINGQVELKETNSQQPAQRPVEIGGDWLQVKNAAEPKRTTVVVKGKPGLIAASGMEMQGETINLERGRNLLWINGAGRMVLPPRAARAGPAPAAPTNRSQFASLDSLSDAPVQIDFRGGMRFDGRVARFDRQINIHSQAQAVRPNHPHGLETNRRELKTEVVEAVLKNPVDFAAEKVADDAEIETIACLGPVLMIEQTNDNRGLIATATLSARDLTIQQTTGKIHALGPGTLKSTRIGSSDPFSSRTARKTAKTKTADEPAYMRVDYEREITGNLHHKVIQLHDDIRGVYGPVEHWGEELPLNPSSIRQGDLIFGADRLQVSQAPGGDPNHNSLEFRADGNTRVDGQNFSATAHQLSYVQGKGQLTLKGAGPMAGEGQNDAVLYYQRRPGGPQNELKAGTITYWPQTNHVDLDKARTLQFFDAGQ